MTKDSAKALMDNPAIKLVGLVFTQTVMGCALYYGLRSEIRENKATQTGVDNLQDLRLTNAENAIDDIERSSFSFAPQPAMKPKPIEVEAEP